MSLIPKIEDKKYPFVHKICFNCGLPRTSFEWCQSCESARFRDSFWCWTSENQELDGIIRESQLNAKMAADFLEWIPYDQFEEISFVGRGIFSTVYSAMWLEGPLRDFDQEIEMYHRCGPTQVALKRLDNSQELHATFLDSLKRHRRCLQSSVLADVIGITRDNTGGYMFVTSFYEEGNLYDYLEKNFDTLSWIDRLDVLWGIVGGLAIIHDESLYHGNLHGGNLLVEAGEVSLDVRISDVGICGPADRWSNNSCGVLPYVAPEVLRGNHPTAASDIYSFGIIMWQMATGLKPFSTLPHDISLASNICHGLRLKVSDDVPELYVNLMKRCWDSDPNNRPTASNLNATFSELITEVCDNPVENDYKKAFSNAEKKRTDKLLQYGSSGIVPKTHDQATYFSQPLNFPQLKF